MQPRLLKHPARLAGASLLRLQDDQRLVALAREGHDPAFAAIVDRYGQQLQRYCARLLGPGRAEDAVQQAFVNAHAAMRASDQELALKPWLYRIAHNASLNILRASKRDAVALDTERPGTTQTADVVELRERLRETLAAIQVLPAPQRDALLLRELEGRSHEEIAAALGVTEGGARQHLHRARVSLRAAVTALTPYPLLARVLSAAAADGGRSTELVSGAGLGASAGAAKAVAGVLAAGAIAGGAVTAEHHRRDGADDAAAAATAAPAPKPQQSAGRPATTVAAPARRVHHEHGRHRDDTGRADDHGRRHGSSDGDHSGRREDDVVEREAPGEDHRGSHEDDHVTTVTTNDNSGPGPGSDTASGSSGPGSGELETDTTTAPATTTTTTTTAEPDHSGPGGGGSDD